MKKRSQEPITLYSPTERAIERAKQKNTPLKASERDWGFDMPKPVKRTKEESEVVRVNREKRRDKLRKRRVSYAQYEKTVTMPEIGGRVLKEKHLEAFNMYFTGKNDKEICAELGIKRDQLRRWKSQDWWKERYEEEVKSSRDSFQANLAAYHREIFDTYKDIIHGRVADPKMANAQVAAVKLFMESGDDPILKKRHNMTINQTTQIGQMNVDMDKMKDITPERLLEMARTGELPEDVIVNK